MKSKTVRFNVINIRGIKPTIDGQASAYPNISLAMRAESDGKANQ